jgi:hypothetical protein
MTDMVTVQQAAEIAGTCPETIRRSIRHGELKAVYTGNRKRGYRILINDLEKVFPHIRISCPGMINVNDLFDGRITAQRIIINDEPGWIILDKDINDYFEKH